MSRAKHAVKRAVAIFEGYLKSHPRHLAWNQASVPLVKAAKVSSCFLPSI